MFTCPYCEKTYKSESRFLSHQCKEKTRFELSKTLPGKKGYNFFVMWFSLQRRGSPSHDSFLKSKYFNAFVEFANFAIRVKMSDPEFYIRTMIQKNFPPDMWRLDDTFALYLHYIVFQADPIDQINKTVRFLTKMADKMECDYSSIIQLMEAEDILFFIRQGEISPWILMNSTAFKQVFMEDGHDHEYAALKTLIKPAFWKYKFNKQPKMLALAKAAIKEMGL